MTQALSRTFPRRTPASTPIVHAALVGDGAADPKVVAELVGSNDWCEVVPLAVDSFDDPALLKQIDVAILLDEPHADRPAGPAAVLPFDKVLTLLRKHRIGAAVLTDRPWAYAGFVIGVVCVPPDASRDVLRGVCLALAHLRPILRQLDLELTTMEHLGHQLERHFDEVNHELRLAARLQQDFLPRELPNDGPIRFRTLFRPCSWVSGDTFDIFRLDERHIGLYVADAVGHGVAAGLLTMYVRRAIQPKRIMLSGYELIPPGEVLQQLNDQFCDQKLPDPHFITAIYGLVNLKSLRLDYAVAGHPPALRIAPGGDIAELPGEGSLLGLGAGQTYETHSTHLMHGERIVIYSDGLEPAIIRERRAAPEQPVWADAAGAILRGPADQLAQQLFDRVDRTPGSLRHADDVSAIILDVDPH
jgi:sigma-B regulation protein RsbU (phosphoserine phosphatase)